jgi:hypothetical protein
MFGLCGKPLRASEIERKISHILVEMVPFNLG